MKIKKIKINKSMIKKALKVISSIICVILVVAIAGTATAEIYIYKTKGDYTLLNTDTKKAYATEYKTVKQNPKNDHIGRYWRDGMIGGNGKLGFVNAGSPYNDTIIYQDVDFIMPTDRDRYQLDDLYKDVEDIRQAIVNCDDSYVSADCKNWNYNYAFHPGHQLRMTQEKQVFYNDYIRWTDYETGEVGVSYKDKNGTFERDTFTSRTDDVTITKIEQSSTGSKINMTLSIDDASSMFKYGYGDETKMQYKKLVDDDCTYIAQVAHYPNFEKSSLGKGGFAGVTYVITVGGTKEKIMGESTNEDINVGDGNPQIKITDAQAVYLITKSDRTFDMGDFNSFKDEKNYQLTDSLVADCKYVADKYSKNGEFDYSAALAPSSQKQKAMFDTVSFSLGDENDEDKLLSNEKLLSAQRGSKKLNDAMVERIYNQARYAMICSSGYSMSRLSGMWTGEWMPGWRSMYTMDANVNLQSSGMNTANIEQFGEGYINFILRQIDDWTINAEKCYNMKDAIMAPVNTDGDGALNAEYCLDYPFNVWNAGTSWMLLPIYEFYQCYGNMTIATDDGNKDLLNDILLPLLTMQSNFWTQLCTPEYYTDKDGNACYEKGKKALNADEKYLIIPSYSPENKTGGDNYNSTLSANSAIDISAAKSGIEMTIDVENQTKTEGYKKRVNALKKFKSKLPDYQFDDTGAIKEWCANQYEDNNEHRHISHLYLAWPSYETHNNKKLQSASLQAMDNRKVENSASHGWVHKGLVYARLGESDRVYDTLHTLLDSKICYQSLMTDHNTDRGSNTYCTDTEFGIVGIINESLLYSNTGVIDVLPSLPKEWSKGQISGLVARTDAIVNIKWSNNKAEVTIKSNKPQTINVSCNNKAVQSVQFTQGETKTFTFKI